MGTTHQFALSAAMGGMAEIELSKLALRNSSNSKIKSFAQMMVNDHSKANSELKSMATSKGIELPTSLDKEHAAAVEVSPSKPAPPLNKPMPNRWFRTTKKR
jgi:putative membrane protein